LFAGKIAEVRSAEFRGCPGNASVKYGVRRKQERLRHQKTKRQRDAGATRYTQGTQNQLGLFYADGTFCKEKNGGGIRSCVDSDCSSLALEDFQECAVRKELGELPIWNPRSRGALRRENCS